jgi:hypothetical protein
VHTKTGPITISISTHTQNGGAVIQQSVIHNPSINGTLPKMKNMKVNNVGSEVK